MEWKRLPQSIDGKKEGRNTFSGDDVNNIEIVKTYNAINFIKTLIL